MVTRVVEVVNEKGLHARAAAKCVQLASRFSSQIRVQRGNQEMDGKSIMGILLLAAARGSRLTISAEGEDEAAALAALSHLFETGFGEAS